MHMGQLKRSADFQRLLDTPVKQRSAHFALHHMAQRPSRTQMPVGKHRPTDLSTGHAVSCPEAVDEPLQNLWLGCMVPKRHAKRAVTRNLLKRQMRAATLQCVQRLPAGLCLLRLRQPFSLSQFPSARSQALSAAVRDELDQLLQRFADLAARAVVPVSAS